MRSKLRYSVRKRTGRHKWYSSHALWRHINPPEIRPWNPTALSAPDWRRSYNKEDVPTIIQGRRKKRMYASKNAKRLANRLGASRSGDATREEYGP